MVGTVIILHNNGWTCSNTANISSEEDPLFDAKGNLTGVDTINRLWAESAFTVMGKPIDNETVECLMRFTDGQKVLFGGRVDGIAKSGTLRVVITGELDDSKININKFLERVRKWQEE